MLVRPEVVERVTREGALLDSTRATDVDHGVNGALGVGLDRGPSTSKPMASPPDDGRTVTLRLSPVGSMPSIEASRTATPPAST